MRKLILPFAALLLLAAAPPAAPPEGTIQVTPASIKWGPGPLRTPAGTMSAVIEGDPQVEGQMFTMRLKLPAGSHLNPHYHPENERVTVLSGEARVGFGDTLRDSGLTTFGPGSFYVNPKGAHHFVVFPKETIIQITGRGAWRTKYLEDE